MVSSCDGLALSPRRVRFLRLHDHLRGLLQGHRTHLARVRGIPRYWALFGRQGPLWPLCGALCRHLLNSLLLPLFPSAYYFTAGRPPRLSFPFPILLTYLIDFG